MNIELTKDQLHKLVMLAQLGEYYMESMEPSHSCFKSDMEYLVDAQIVINDIQQQFLEEK